MSNRAGSFLSTYCLIKEAAQAVQYLTRAIQAGSEDPTIRYHLGSALIADGQQERGKATLQEAVQSANNEGWLDDAKQKLNAI